MTTSTHRGDMYNMNENLTKIQLTIDEKAREQYLNRVYLIEVLGGIEFIPNTELSTTKQVADFYKVDPYIIRKCYMTYKDELTKSGLVTLTNSDVRKYLSQGNCDVEPKDIGCYKWTNAFTKQAVINVGLIILQSEIAEKLRNYCVTNYSTNIVTIQDNQVVTTSLQVAEYFSKQHKHIIESIKNLTAENSALLNMFHETTYLSSQNKTLPMYMMNRDGFTLLVMGFTGKKAVQFKIQYINQFNEMEEELKERNTPSYMIEDPIKRAERWIEEQKGHVTITKKLKEELAQIEADKSVETVEALSQPKTPEIVTTVREDREQIFKLVTNNSSLSGEESKYRFNLMYDFFESEHSIDLKDKKNRYELRYGVEVPYITFIEKLGMIKQLKEIAIELFGVKH